MKTILIALAISLISISCNNEKRYNFTINDIMVIYQNGHYQGQFNTLKYQGVDRDELFKKDSILMRNLWEK